MELDNLRSDGECLVTRVGAGRVRRCSRREDGGRDNKYIVATGSTRGEWLGFSIGCRGGRCVAVLPDEA